MNQSTRQQIISMLKTKGPLTVSSIAKELDITEMAVRRHLTALERDHLVIASLVRQAMGRPSNVYRLTEQADHLFPRNYSDLALDFLKDLEETDGLEKVVALFKRRKDRLAEEIKEKIHGLPLEEKVVHLANWQDQKGYMVKLEKKASGEFLIQENNCPISHIAKSYHIACDCELQLFREILDADVEQNVCYAKGGPNCMFTIKEKEQPLSK